MELSCHYIDICYPDYLQDHHNRDNEILLSASVWEGMTTDELVQKLYDCLNSTDNHFPFTEFSEEEIKYAFRSESDCFISSDFGLHLPSYECLGEVYLYAYLRWEEVETEIKDYPFKNDSYLFPDYEGIDRI